MLDMEKVIVSHSLVYIKSGMVKVQTYDYQEFTLKEGEMLFMPRESYLISDYINTNKEMDVYLFFFDHALSNEFLQSKKTVSTHTNSKMMKIELSKNIHNYLNILDNTHYKSNTNEPLLKTKLLELLHLISEVNHEFVGILKAHELQQKETSIQTYMLKHFDKNLTLNDWAALSGHSLSTFTRKFKRWDECQ